MLRHLSILLIAVIMTAPSYADTTRDWVVANSHSKVTPATAHRIVNEAVSAGSRHDVDPILILAVMRMESGYREKVVSREGATCLMQVIPRWHREKIGKRNLVDINTCIDVGTRILKEYRLLCRQDIKCTLTKYSGGDRKYAAAVLAWRAKIVMETRDAVTYLAALSAK